MKARRSVSVCLTFLLALFAGTAIAQQCSQIQGSPWTDKYGYHWYITASGDGFVDTGYCGWWGAAGYGVSGGHFYVSVVNPTYPGPDPEVCGAWFEYEGDLETGGCNVGDGTWHNSFDSDSFWWEKTCEVPSGETTAANDLWWSDQTAAPSSNGPYYLFGVEAPDTSGGNLSGRTIRETNFGTAADYCWFTGSSVPKVTGVTAPPPNTLGAGNSYGDNVGWHPDAIDYYRLMGSAPCSVVMNQRMQIACNDHGFFGTSTSWETYKDNYLIAVIGVSPQNQVANERDSVLHTNTWP